MSDNPDQSERKPGLYDYKSNFNLVLQADRSALPKRSNEPTGEPETIWGRVDPKEMGARASRSTPAEELGADVAAKGGVQVVGGGSRRREAEVSSAFSSRDSRQEYALLLNFILKRIGDQSESLLKGVADEVLAVFERARGKDQDMLADVSSILGSELSLDDFETIKALSVNLVDASVEDGAGEDGSALEGGVAVVFDDEDEENGDYVDVEEMEEVSDEEGRDVEQKEEGVEDMEEVLELASNKKKLDTSSLRSVDADWLNELLRSRLGLAKESSKMSEKVLELLGGTSSLRRLENGLIELLGFSDAELLQFIAGNAKEIYWRTKLAAALPAEKDSIISQIRDEGYQGILKDISAGSSDVVGLSEETKQRLQESATEPSRLAPKEMLNLSLLAFQEGSHLMTNKRCDLPEGSYKTKGEGFEEVVVPAPKAPPFAASEQLIAISSLPEWSQAAFKNTDKLNRVQSRVFECAFGSDKNMLLCAPTGAGKTNVAMLTLLREIGKHINPDTNSVDLKNFKVVYIAPMKALVQEMVGNFRSRLSDAYGIVVSELTGDQQLSKKQISETQIIVTTPEKWDIVTRKSNDRSYTQLVRLVIIDEVHLLHDDRGPTLEAIVSRTLRQVESTQKDVRIVGLSATLPNYTDVAHFLRVDRDDGLFHFDSSYRPCPLQQTYVGITDKKPLQRAKRMNEITYEKCYEHAKNNQILVFVHSRKETARTARVLKEMAEQNGTAQLFGRQGTESQKILKSEGELSRNGDLKELLPAGFAIHHAGMKRADRSLVEDLFADGHISVLVSTATLAWGVNLPAHTVIIKGTEVYSAEKGQWVELSPQDMLQMLGRAGRPQYDTFGEGIIITSHTELQFYLSLLNTQLPIESQLISKLPDLLNAEVVAATIRNRDDAVRWLGYSYLYVRMLKSPHTYGVPVEAVEDDTYLQQRRTDLVHAACNLLEKSRLVKYDRRSGLIQTTELGRIASYYYITHSSMNSYNASLKPSLNMVEILGVFALSDEFKHIPVRPEERVELDRLIERVPIPIKETTDDPRCKVNILLQAYISRLKLEGFALTTDMIYISQSAGRILRAMFEICLRQEWGQLSLEILDLCKMVDNRMWSCLSPLRQFRGISLDLVSRIEKKGFPWERMAELNAQEIGELVGNSQAGRTVYDLIQTFPRLEIQARVQPITPSTLQVDILATPKFRFSEYSEDQGFSAEHPHNPAGEVFWVFILDCDCEKILFHEQIVVNAENSEETHSLMFTVPISEPVPPNYYVSVTSDRWLRCDVRLPVSFRQLILPQRFPPYTELEDTDPIVVATLDEMDRTVLELNSIQYLNSVQTHCYPAICGTDSVFIGAPSGSGLGVCIDLAVVQKLKSFEPGEKLVFLSPFQERCQQKMIQWKRMFTEFGVSIGHANGSLAANLRTVEENDIVLITARHFDHITRRWRQRKGIQRISMVCIDELHAIGAAGGSVLEAGISRIRYMSSQLDSEIRIVATSLPVGCSRDISEWMGCSAGNTFNFSPVVRPVPLEIHLQTVAISHYDSLLHSIIKSTSVAVQKYCISPGVRNQAILFTSSEEVSLKAALEILELLTRSIVPFEDGEFRFKTSTFSAQNSDYHTLMKYGIGVVDKSLSDSDRRLICSLYSEGFLQILVVGRESSRSLFHSGSGQSLTSHLVVVMGSQYFDGKDNRFIDYSLQEVLQLSSRARVGDVEDDDSEGVSRVVIFSSPQRKSFYKRFLYEGLPVESELDHQIPDVFNAEIIAKTIENKQDAVDFLTWTFLYRRLAQNPNFYNLRGSSHGHLSSYLSELVENTISDLANSKCIEVEEDDVAVAPLNLGLIAAYYYVSCVTMDILSMSLTEGTKLRGLIEIFCSAVEFDALPIRRNEREILRNLRTKCPLKFKQGRLNDPHTKVNILLQSHFSRFKIPEVLRSDLIDLVFDRMLDIVYAGVDVLSSNGWLPPALACMELCQMIVQAVWGDQQSVLRQLPHFDSDRIELARSLGVETVFDISEIEDESIREKLLEGLTEAQLGELAMFVNRYPSVEVQYGFDMSEEGPVGPDCDVAAEDDLVLNVAVEREMEDDEELEPLQISHLPNKKEETWWLVVGDTSAKTLLSIKRFTFSQAYRTRLAFQAPGSAGTYNLKLYLMNDSWIGCDQEYDLKLNVVEEME